MPPEVRETTEALIGDLHAALVAAIAGIAGALAALPARTAILDGELVVDVTLRASNDLGDHASGTATLTLPGEQA